MQNCADLELTFNNKSCDDYLVEFRFRQPGSQTDYRIGGGATGGISPIVSLPGTLFTNNHLLDMDLYGRTLTEAVFSSPELKTGFENACTVAASQNLPLRIRLWFASDATRLHDLAWETLQHPTSHACLSTSENFLLSRYLSSESWKKTELPALGALKALVVVANPVDLVDNHLPPIDVVEEIACARQGFGPLPLVTLPNASGQEPATLNNIIQHLREGYDVLYLVCHSLIANEHSWLWLEDEQRKVSRHSATEVAENISRMHNPPMLVILVACQSAGNLKENIEGRAMCAIGPRLVDAGVPAVVAMQTNLLMGTAAQFMPLFLAELARDGQIDRALTVARSRVLKQSDWWAPVLFSRLADNLLFVTTSAPLVKQGLEALGELIQLSSDVRSNVSQFRADFASACQQVDRLADYKDLHDLLHRLQFDFYNMVIFPAARFPGDESVVDELLQYYSRLEEIVHTLENILSRPSINITEKMWASKVETAYQDIGRALEHGDVALLKKSLLAVRIVLANQPTKINSVLTEAARALRLETLVNDLNIVNNQVQKLDPGLEYVAQFQDGLQAMSTLNQDLNTQVSEHDHWQAIEIELRQFEDTIETGQLDELKLFWPDVKTDAIELYKSVNDDWARKLLDATTALDQSIIEDNPLRIKRAFRDYRSRVGTRFFQVDTNLKNLCNEIRKIGSPLNAVLRMIE